MEMKNSNEINITDEKESITSDSVINQNNQQSRIHKKTSIMNKHYVCAYCGFKNHRTDIECKECGATLDKQPQKSNNKKAIKFVLPIVIIVLIIATTFFGMRYYKISKSEESFKKAEHLLSKEKYKEALSSYALVIKEDTNNYRKSQKKTKEIKEKLNYFKRCAKALVAVESTCPYFDTDEILNIYYAEKDSAFGIMYGKESVTIITNHLSTECTFIISSTKNEALEESYPVYYDSKFNLYIHAIGVENFSKGWLESTWDYITDTYKMMAESDCKEANIEYVKKYANEIIR